jgi:acyl-CoA thioesterase FadM
MAAHFQKEFQLHFREADPAGIMFFGNIFSLAHDCFEDFIQAAGFTWKDWFHTKDYLIPIRHTESNYLKPFLPGDTYQIQASVSRMGNSSFQMKYVFKNKDVTHAQVTMTHTFLDARTKDKISVPDLVRTRLKVYTDA